MLIWLNVDVITEAILCYLPYLLGYYGRYLNLNCFTQVNLVDIGDMRIAIDYLGTFICRGKYDLPYRCLPPTFTIFISRYNFLAIKITKRCFGQYLRREYYIALVFINVATKYSLVFWRVESDPVRNLKWGYSLSRSTAGTGYCRRRSDRNVESTCGRLREERKADRHTQVADTGSSGRRI